MAESHSADQWRRFLDGIASFFSVSRACLDAGISRSAAYARRDRDPKFAEQWEEARRIGAEVIEDEMVRRGVEGVERPVFFEGKQVATVREFSDATRLALAKGALAKRYGNRLEIDATVAVEVWERETEFELWKVVNLVQARMALNQGVPAGDRLLCALLAMARYRQLTGEVIDAEVVKPAKLLAPDNSDLIE
jgi:hypothetical protein